MERKGCDARRRIRRTQGPLSGRQLHRFGIEFALRHGVDLVIRGEDLLASTGRQMRLARLLGRRVVAGFLHHPLVRRPSGEKLSKASGDTGIRELRAVDVAPVEVLERARSQACLRDFIQ